MNSRKESDGASLETWSSSTRGFLPSNKFGLGQDDLKMSKLEQGKAPPSRLAAHGNNDVSFMVYRRFAWLHLQVLLWGDELLTDPNVGTGGGPSQRDDFFARPWQYLSQLITKLLARYGK